MEQRDPDAGTFLEPLIDTLVAFWPVWLMLGALFLLVAIYRLYEYRRLARSGIHDIDRMDGRTFERYVATMFTRLGYTVELTRFAGDYGGDLVLRKDGVRSVVQAKRYRKSVGVKAVQEVVASKAVYKATEAIVITNNEYTRAAKHLARKNGVILWDREALASRLSQTSAKERASQVAPEVAAPSQTAPAMKMDVVPLADVAACATCHKVLTAAERGYCERNMKDFNGRMLCYRHQRGSRR